MKIKTGSLFFLKAFIGIIFFTQLFMLIDTSILHIHACIIQNIIGCIVTAVLFIFGLKKTSPLMIIFLLLLHLELQVFIAIILSGWRMQFQYYYLAILIFSIFMTFSFDSRKLSFKQKFLATTSTIFFFSSYIYTRNFPPVYNISEKTILRISLLNYASIFIGLGFLSNLFRINAYRFAYTIKKQSYRDELTTLFNRRGIRSELDKAMDSQKNDGIPYSVAIFDIDDFKKINDTYGHDIGDIVLKKIGAVLHGFENDLVTACRWGGEEFLILRHYSTYKDSMPDLAQKIAQKIAQLDFSANGENFKITITGGCANSEKNLELAEVIKLADNRLYRGKETGKNKIVSTDI